MEIEPLATVLKRYLLAEQRSLRATHREDGWSWMLVWRLKSGRADWGAKKTLLPILAALGEPVRIDDYIVRVEKVQEASSEG